MKIRFTRGSVLVISFPSLSAGEEDGGTRSVSKRFVITVRKVEKLSRS